MSFFRIKICGITSVQDAIGVSEAGADAIGLNFYHKSPRRVEVKNAAVITRELENGIATVGVFVDQSPEQINRIAAGAGIDFVQLHGHYTVDDWRQIERPAYPAIRLPACPGGAEETVQSWRERIRPWGQAGCDRILLDAYSAIAFGGTGNRLDWPIIQRLGVSLPIILAGGLNAENIAEAIAVAQPAAVDAASGVESEPGVKDLVQVRQFVEHSRRAFRTLSVD